MTTRLETPDALDRWLADPPRPDAAARAGALARQRELTKPPGALGRLEEIAVWLAGWQGTSVPQVARVEALVFAGNHGVAARGVSPYPAEVTAQMAANFAAGGAAINQLCASVGVGLRVVPLALDRPTGDIAARAAMTVEECLSALNAGLEAVPSEIDLLVLGEMGIANTTVAAALAATVCGGSGADWAGAGTGLDAAGVTRKADIVDAALARHGARATRPFETLRRLGGREQAALAGAVLGARLKRVPVLLDGFVCTASAAVLTQNCGDALDHCLAGHVSSERGHRRLLRALGLAPILDLGMRLGEGSGAALAVAVLRAAVATHGGMATFAEAGVNAAPG